MQHDTHIDHIDPSWAEGRDYMLVCGLDVVYNMCERDPYLNRSKSNRFLPWRNSHDEIGTDPVEQGDLCLFLDPDTNEWVLEEFMGTWWVEKSGRYAGCNNRIDTDETRAKKSASSLGKPKSAKHRANIAKAKKGVKRPPMTEDHKRKISQAGKGSRRSDEAKRKMSEGQTLRHARNRCRRMSFSDPQMPNFED